MAVFYRKYQDKRNGSSSFGKWYGRSVMLNVVSTKELAEEIAHATTVTYADVVAVLAETSQALKRHLQNSHKVELDGIGSFKVGLSTSGANTSAEFGAQNVKGFRINYSPEVHFVGNGQVSEKNHRKGTFVKDLLYGVTAKEAPKNALSHVASPRALRSRVSAEGACPSITLHHYLLINDLYENIKANVEKHHSGGPQHPVGRGHHPWTEQLYVSTPRRNGAIVLLGQ